MQKIILCSSSASRKMLLEKLQLAFDVMIPDVDETPLRDESPQALVVRLAVAKAKKHEERFPNALLIGSDTVAAIDGLALSKPESHEEAVAQLQRFSGRSVTFWAGLAVWNTRTGHLQTAAITTTAVYKKLSAATIADYLERDQPYHCAGSVKAEGLGIALFDRLVSDDPTALIGLPLISLTQMLENEGIRILDKF